MSEGPEPGTAEGRFEDQAPAMAWRVTVSPYDADELGPTTTRQLRLLRVEVEVVAAFGA